MISIQLMTDARLKKNDHIKIRNLRKMLLIQHSEDGIKNSHPKQRRSTLIKFTEREIRLYGKPEFRVLKFHPFSENYNK